MAVPGRATADGTHSIVADIGSFENTENPDNDLPDSNPYGVLALAGKTLVANAGANALFEIRANGDIRTLAVFEEQPFPGGPNITISPSRRTAASTCRRSRRRFPTSRAGR
jgi:hypothetical protein